MRARSLACFCRGSYAALAHEGDGECGRFDRRSARRGWPSGRKLESGGECTMAMELMRRPWSGAAGNDLMRDFVPLRTMMDRLFETAFTPTYWGNGASGGFGMDVYEGQDAYTIHCLLPGIDPNKVSVTVQDNVLTIEGESTRTPPEDAQTLFQEIAYGPFKRQVTLGTPVDASRA